MRLVKVPVDQVEVVPSVFNIDVIMTQFTEAISSRSVTIFVSELYNVFYVTILHLLIVSVVQTDWVLMSDV